MPSNKKRKISLISRLHLIDINEIKEQMETFLEKYPDILQISLLRFLLKLIMSQSKLSLDLSSL